MKVLILGGGGNIGFWLEKLFLESKHAVCSIQRGLSRLKRSHPNDASNFLLKRLDISEFGAMSREFVMDFDLVVDFICFDEATAYERIRLLSKFSGLYILVSTVAVYDRTSRKNCLNSESSCKNLFWSYAQKKYMAEKVFLEGIATERLKICRLGHTFDTSLPVPFGATDWTFVQWLMDRNSMMLFRGSDSSWPLLHSRDAARRILLVATEPSNFASVINIVNSQSKSWTEIGKTFFSNLNIPESFQFINIDLIRDVYPYWHDSVVFHKQFDEVFIGDEIRKFSEIESKDWNLANGLRIALDFYRENRSFQIVNQYDYEQFLTIAKKAKV